MGSKWQGHCVDSDGKIRNVENEGDRDDENSMEQDVNGEGVVWIVATFLMQWRGNCLCVLLFVFQRQYRVFILLIPVPYEICKGTTIPLLFSLYISNPILTILTNYHVNGRQCHQ
jgi:hypothetical protein